jgi:type II secretory ATPase GspE/PulE/Tfp pilus assembly ATPase PilB-like protein
MSSKEMDPAQTLELQALRVNGHNGHNGHAGVPAWVAPVAFRWPAPPYCQPALSAAPAHACRVEFADGVDETVELISIEETGRTAQVRTAGADSQSLALDGVRSITATRAVECVLDAAAGADKVRTFAVHFKGGAKLSGRTRGLVRSHGGLFFFLAHAEQPAVTPCYVPLTQVESFNVGASLGQTVKAHDAAETRALDEALDCPPEERDRRLGEYLAGRAIGSARELKDALGAQDRAPRQRLGEILVDAGIVTQVELDRALAQQASSRGRRLGDVLVAMGIVSLRTIQVMLSEKLGIPYVDAEAFEVEAGALALVPQEFAQQHGVLPLLRLSRALVIAVENPLAIDFEQRLRFATGCAIVAVMGDPQQIAARVAAEYAVAAASAAAAEPRPGHARDDIEQLARKLEREAPSAAIARRAVSEAAVNDSTLVRLVNKIVIDAHARGASDIHIEASLGQKVRVRFRCDGELVEYLQLRPAYAAAVVSRIKIMAGLDIAERRLPQDGKIRFGRFAPLAIELRVAVVPTTENSEDIVLRILGGAGARPIEQIGLTERNVVELKRMTGRNHGLVLVCGPTGSGKTTTLHSVLRHLNRADLKIWTAEDPVEIVQPGLRQVQVNPQIGLGFAQAMRSFLRADPDVVMVGEMRDAETARTAIEASLTGHLVLSTLHTNSAAETVTRLLDMGMDPFNFSDSLVGVLSQRLARRLCPVCRRPHELDDAEARDLAAEYCQGTSLAPDAVLAEWRAKSGGTLTVNRAVGCEQCDRGYRGRAGIHELLSVTPEMRRMIRTRRPADELAELAQAGGMRLLKQDAIEKVLVGEIDLASARTASN